MKLTDLMKVWEIVHVKNIGDLGFCDIEKAVEEVCGIENDVPGFQPCTQKIVDDSELLKMSFEYFKQFCCLEGSSKYCHHHLSTTRRCNKLAKDCPVVKKCVDNEEGK